MYRGWRSKCVCVCVCTVCVHTRTFRESERIKGNRRVIQRAHNVSTLFSVGGRPGGMLPNTRGRNSTALSAEILIIHLHCFRKAKQPDERTVEPWAGVVVVSVHEERFVKDLLILLTGSRYFVCQNFPIAQNHHNVSARGVIRFLIDAKGSAITSLNEIYSFPWSHWNKYSVPPSGALRHIDRIHLSWGRWL